MPEDLKPENNIDEAKNSLGDEPCETDCRTKGLAASVSQCLLNRPRCRYSYSFGYAFFCNHPRHREFRNKP